MRAFGLVLVILLAGCRGVDRRRPADEKLSLPEARRGFRTRLVKQEPGNEPVPVPPARLFRLVHYPSPVGNLAAYVSQPSASGTKHPAMIRIFGGFGNGIGETAWEAASPANDQSARAFREAGIVTMYPSLRGGNSNPGYPEGFYGEADDVLAAADYLARQPFVDPRRLYLGGHSTGGTLALLVAAATSRFRGVFAFGPVADVAVYGAEQLPFDTANPRELELRAPARWLHSIRSPVYVIEGTQGNFDSLQAMQQVSRNPMVHFVPVKGANHFNVLSPLTRQIAARIMRDGSAAEPAPAVAGQPRRHEATK